VGNHRYSARLQLRAATEKYLQTKALKIFALVSGTLLSLLIVLLIKWQFLYDLQP